MKKLKEAKNKIKKVAKEHRKTMKALFMFGVGFVGVTLYRRHTLNIANEAFKAGSRVTDIAHNSAAVKVTGLEKAAEIAKEAAVNESLMIDKFASADMSFKQFNNMYDHNVLGMQKLLTKQSK